MQLVEAPDPRPGKGELRVRVRAASANPADWKIRGGMFKLLLAGSLPRGMGHDFAGTVDALGEGVTQHHVGDDVYGVSSMRRSGAFADYLIISAKEVYPKPENLSFELAAALPMTAITAWSGVMERANLQPGQTVFVAGCLGGIGRCAVQLALMRGAIVLGNCSATGRAEAQSLGVREVTDYRHFDADKYRNRFDLIFDTAGGLTVTQCEAMLKRKGHAVHAVPSGKNFTRILLSRRHSIASGRPNPQRMEGITEAAQIGALLPKVGRTVSLSDAVSALTELEKAKGFNGKLVIVT